MYVFNKKRKLLSDKHWQTCWVWISLCVIMITDLCKLPVNFSFYMVNPNYIGPLHIYTMYYQCRIHFYCMQENEWRWLYQHCFPTLSVCTRFFLNHLIVSSPFSSYPLVLIFSKHTEQRNVWAVSLYPNHLFHSWISVYPMSCQFWCVSTLNSPNQLVLHLIGLVNFVCACVLVCVLRLQFAGV